MNLVVRSDCRTKLTISNKVEFYSIKDDKLKISIIINKHVL